MTVWLPGMKMTAARLNDHTAESTTTTGLTASSGFSVNSFQGRKVNGVTFVEIFCTRTGANITEGATNSGNITDTSMCTLPSGWRPQDSLNADWGNGTVSGECTIDTAGIVTLRTITGSGTAGAGLSGTAGSGATNVRVTATWISENG